MYCKRLAHMIMEAKKSYVLPSIVWKSRITIDMDTYKLQSLRTRESMVNISLLETAKSQIKVPTDLEYGVGPFCIDDTLLLCLHMVARENAF